MKKNYIVSKEVIYETPGGSQIIALHLSQEARDGLTIRHIPLALPVPDKTSYRFHVRQGDAVRWSSDGVVYTGTIRMVEDCVRDHERIVSVDVDGAPRRCFGLRPPLPVRFADEEINWLELMITQEEWDAIIAECNE